MRKVLSIEEINNRLLKKSILLIDPYLGMNHIMQFKCVTCSFIWRRKGSDVINKNSRCPYCSNMRKRNIDIVKFKANLNFKNLETDKIPNHTYDRINYTCLNCGYIFEAWAGKMTAKNITGCSKCSKVSKYSEKEIDEKLINTNFKRIGLYFGAKIPLEIECKICLHHWFAASTNFFNNKYGCPKCKAKKIGDRCRFSKEKFLSFIDTSKIDVIEYNGYQIKSKFLCKICSKNWETLPIYLKSNIHGCPFCNHKFNEKLVGKFLYENNINFTNNFKLKELKANFQNSFRVDFYLPDFNLIIEYNGQQHYEIGWFHKTKEENIKAFEKQQKRDLAVKNFCQLKGINFLEIDGRKYKRKKLEDFLNDYFREAIKFTVDKNLEDQVKNDSKQLEEGIACSIDNKEACEMCSA